MKRAMLIALMILALAGLASPPVRPVAAQSGVVWQAQFYNNLYLSGNAVLTTQYNNLDLYWGQSSPGTGVNADNFSARIAADPYFEAGTYRFYILADDGVQFWIDFPPPDRPNLTTLNAPRPGQMLTVDAVLTAGTHHIQIDYRELSGDAYVYVRWANLATNPTPPSFPVPVSAATGAWTAQYYNNATLTGSPVATQSENTVAHDWGAQVPLSGVPADFFSVRWTSVQTLSGGTYDLRVTADDGVRVWIDGALMVDEWHTATGQTYARSLPLAAGQHAFTVEYYEATGTASINFNLTLPGGAAAPAAPAPGPTGTSVTILAYTLNVRNAPSLSGQILTKVNANQVYPVLGTNASRNWFQINANGTVGWVSAVYVRLNNEATLPITDGSGTAPSGYLVAARVNLNIRSGPSVANARLSVLPAGVSAEVIGRNSASTWWQIKYNTVTGWISGYFADLQAGADLSRIPVTG